MSDTPSGPRLAKRVVAAAGYWCAAYDVQAGRLYCGATDFTVHAWDLEHPGEQPVASLAGHRSYVTALAFSAAQRVLVSGGPDRQLLAWKPGQTSPAWKASVGALVNQLAVSPDGALTAAALDDLTVRLWDVATGKEIRTLRGEHAPRTAIGRPSNLYAIAFRPDGKWIASGDRVGGIVVRDVATGAVVSTPKAESLYSQALYRNNLSPSEYEWGGVRSLAFSPDGKLLFAGGMGPADQNSAGIDGLMRLEVFDAATGKSLQALSLEKSKGLLNAMLAHPDGRRLAAAGGGGGAGAGGAGTLCLWDYSATQPDGKPIAPVLTPTAIVARGLVLRPEARQLIIVGMEKSVTAGRIELWELGGL